MPNFTNISNNITSGNPVIPTNIPFSDPNSPASKAKLTPEEKRKKREELKKSKEEARQKFKDEKAKKQAEAKKKIEELKEDAKKKKEKLQKALKDPKSLIKGENIKDVKKAILALLVPILLQFVRTLNVGDLLVKRIINQTKKQLKNKGSLVIVEGTVSFTPSKKGDWNVYKKNFDTKVNNLKKVILSLQAILSLLTSLLNTLNLALTAYQLILYLLILKLKRAQAKLIKDLTSPEPSKPEAAIEIAQLSERMIRLQKLKDDADTYKLIITAILLFINIFNMALNKLKAKIDRLKFILEPLDDQSAASITNATTAAPTSNEYTNSYGKSYILVLVTFPDRSKQYQALDAFSKMKITQTAPSIIKTPEQLLEEIKQILG